MHPTARSNWSEPKRRGELALALAFFALVTLVFLWPAIGNFDHSSYTSADLSQTYTLTTVGSPQRAGNAHLSDPVVEMLPWLEFNRSELSQGRLPTWNPWNGAGVPHLANYQSAVFSPFSLPFYLLPLKWALLVSAFAKLMALGAFTFLFVRALGVGFAGACTAGTIFEFGGHNVLLLAYPHSSVVVALPAALWIIERAWQLVEAGHPARSALPHAAGLCVAFSVALLGGNPECAAFLVALSAIYALARAIGLWRKQREQFRAAVRMLLLLGLGGLVALSIAAIQVLPFLEYVSRSTLIETRADGFDGLRSANWPLQFFPDLLGNPSQRYVPRPGLPVPNYEAVNTAYFGPLTWLAALVGLGLCHRRGPVRFFALLLVVWALGAFDFQWMRPVMLAFTDWTHAPVNRSQFVPLLALAVLAAFAVDRLPPTDGRLRWKFFGGTCVLAALILWVAARGAENLVQQTFQGNPPAGQLYRVPLHVVFMERTFAVGSIVFACLALARAKWLRTTLMAAVLGVLFTQSGWVLRSFNSISRDEHVFPRTAMLDKLATTIGSDRLQVIGEDTLPPHTNMAYGIASVAVYDALWIETYDRLYRELFRSEGNWRETLWTSAHALETLGIRYLLALEGWPRLGPGLAPDPYAPAPPVSALALQPGVEIAQSFRAQEAGLERVTLALGAEDDPLPAFMELVLEDVQSGEIVVQRRLDTHSLRAGIPKHTLSRFAHDLRFSSPTAWVQLAFEPIVESAGREYRLRLRPEPGDWKQGFIAWTVPDLAPPLSQSRQLRHGDQVLDARLCLDWAANFSRDLETLFELGPFTLYRSKTAPGRHWIARATRSAPDAEGALSATLSHDHSPVDVAIVEGVGASDLHDLEDLPFDRIPRVIVETPRHIELEVSVPRAAWLVSAISWYPGWKARVDGRPVAIAKTNYAFLGVPIPAGTHRVQLDFESDSVRIGAWISIAGLGALALLAGLAWRARRAT